MHPVAEYFNALHASLGAGTPETSGYPALANLLNAVGETLKPKISAVIHPANTGSGIPDGGLFSTKDLKKHGADAPSLFDKLKPERGVIEVKPLDKDLSAFESGEQVRNYLEAYGQILLTNYRSFALWSLKGGKPERGEYYHFAPSENEFWTKAHALRADPKHPEYERFWQFLRRALLSNARIANPQDLAAFLASYAREARARVEIAPMGTLEPVKKALTEALGVRFEGEKGSHFFQSTLIQTLFYGIFSAWVLWHESHPKPADRFQWRLSAQHLGLPILRTLFVQLAGDPKKVRALNIEEVLDWTEECLARVDRASFFARYDMGEAVQYFYEPFLAEFDPELRKDFGVWYTPPEIVRYMVGSVDAVLRENFDLSDGLADPSVIVLDPCCGTGAYLVETLRLIYDRLVEGYGKAQAALKIREVAKQRLYGFELLPAPYVVAHLQIDLLLTRWGAELNHDQDERAGVFLTNALTGWVPVKHPKDEILFSEFADERDQADQVKQKEQILVILGNPPYDGYAGVAIEEERALSQAYRTTKEAPAPQGQGLNDLYIRFFRMAERRIAEGVPEHDDPKPGPPRDDARGIVCFISNYSWLDGLSHPGMRERFMEVFDSIKIDCLNGDKYKTGKKTPDGKPDPSIFSTEKTAVGIQVGTAIALLERRPEGSPTPSPFDESVYQPRAELQFRHWWGKNKRAEIVEALEKQVEWRSLKPSLKFGLAMLPVGVREDYTDWPQLVQLLPRSFPGVKTSRDDAVVSISREALESRFAAYQDSSISDQEVGRRFAPLFQSTKTFNPSDARKKLLEMVPDGAIEILPYAYRPFDVRSVAWEGGAILLDRPRPDYRKQLSPSNLWLSATQRNRKEDFYCPQVTRCLADHHIVESNVGMFPLYLCPDEEGAETSAHLDLFEPTGPQPNLTDFAKDYLVGLKCEPEDLFFHIVGILHAPAYREENGGALRQDWPRIPLPADAATLKSGAALGRQLAALLDPEIPVPGVTDLKIRDDLKGLGELTVSGSAKSPDLAINARWGYAGQNGVTMPGPGKVASGTRGEGFLDIHLNATTRWKDVPEGVWTYTLGGYQVLKKWLSYRELALLGRPLTTDEAQQFTHHVRRIASILALHPSLDAHYRGTTGNSNSSSASSPSASKP
ncbi:type ISP restriction/modification enzyme [Haloferula sp. A504]|uniref:type ISP restriction/modification enzyme n=1 Tax=Haloferula sp. A504 TaxID=3373601 RepID=UPI0031BBFE03|nr:N-6 DNA methylase [Verrucomicrobiaceae bacterium E54]